MPAAQGAKQGQEGPACDLAKSRMPLLRSDFGSRGVRSNMHERVGQQGRGTCAQVALQRERVGLAVALAQAAVHHAVVHVLHALHHLRMMLSFLMQTCRISAGCMGTLPHTQMPVLQLMTHW